MVPISLVHEERDTSHDYEGLVGQGIWKYQKNQRGISTPCFNFALMFESFAEELYRHS